MMYLLHPRGEIQNKEFAQVVQSLQLLGLGFKKRKIN